MATSLASTFAHQGVLSNLNKHTLVSELTEQYWTTRATGLVPGHI